MLLKAAPASVRSPANVVENMVMRGAGFVAVSATLASGFDFQHGASY